MIMNYYKKFIALSLYVLFSLPLCTQAQEIAFEKSESFYANYSNAKRLQQNDISWGYLSIPENWEATESNTIKLGVAILKNQSNIENAEAVVFIQGGPGASGIQNIWTWLNHPMRETKDIVLVDLRGTGFSQPRLCPDLGQEFLKILAKNQSKELDEKEKTIAAMACKQKLLSNGVDIAAYNSISVAKDLHALKEQLSYSSWHVYGVSYGTYMAQVYADAYPTDVKTLLLDSSIEDITTYYTKNTSNYMKSLLKVFKLCENTPDCAEKYPNLENIYYETIAILNENPITVSVDKSIVESGEFTYNTEDFKVAIQQALYNKQLVEVIPLLISQFHDRNEASLGNLVAAFSGLLGLDYGMYYCVSCNETLPSNNISDYNEDASRFKNLDGGISFYKSDFVVCESWNMGRSDSLKVSELSKLRDLRVPVLVFGGEFDPITPASNGILVAKKFENAKAITGFTYGHVPSFTRVGSQVAKKFVDTPNQMVNLDAFKAVPPINIVKNISLNAGVAKAGNSLTQINPIFLAPLLIAVGIMLVFIFVYLIKLIRKKYHSNSDKIVRGLSIVTSILGLVGLSIFVLTLLEVSGQNYFVLAFGLPNKFNYIFTILLIFCILLVITIAVFAIRIKKIEDRSIVSTVLFSNALLVTYILYWGIL